jgi:hypothetical protein
MSKSFDARAEARAAFRRHIPINEECMEEELTRAYSAGVEPRWLMCASGKRPASVDTAARMNFAGSACVLTASKRWRGKHGPMPKSESWRHASAGSPHLQVKASRELRNPHSPRYEALCRCASAQLDT